MPASWVAASVRAQLLGKHRLGRAGAALVAGSAGLSSALQLLAASPYGVGVSTGMSLEAAQRQVASTTLWNLRLLSGWLPPGGIVVLQPLAAWFEIANIEQRLAYLSGEGHPSPYDLGAMGLAWPAVSKATTLDAVRQALARSHWGDPGSSEIRTMMLVVRFRWAAWVANSVPGTRVWAATASALLAARIRFTSPPQPVPPEASRPYGLPAGWQRAASPAELRSMMSGQLSWVLDGVESPSDLWKAEARLWSRVRRDAAKMIVQSRNDPAVVVGIAALLGYDAWLTRAALGAATRGATAREVFDAVA
jgi:hypothetical protein